MFLNIFNLLEVILSPGEIVSKFRWLRTNIYFYHNAVDHIRENEIEKTSKLHTWMPRPPW